jgi:riboflavin transporter FmnP
MSTQNTAGARGKLLTVNTMTKISMMGVLAFVIMIFEFAIPGFPGFLKLDFSDIIPLLGAFAFGPAAGVLIELVKCFLHWIFMSTTGGVGDLANFAVGSAFVGSAGLFYSRFRTFRGAIISLGIGTVSLIVIGAVVNYFIMVPWYGAIFFKEAGGVEGVVGLASVAIPAIHNKLTLVLYAFCPFNLIKGLVISVIVLPLYKRVSPLLKMEIGKTRQRVNGVEPRE